MSRNEKITERSVVSRKQNSEGNLIKNGVQPELGGASIGILEYGLN